MRPFPFFIGHNPDADDMVEAMQFALDKNYKVSAENLQGANFVRMAVENINTGNKEVVDLRYGGLIGKTGNGLNYALNLQFHGGTSQAPVTGQVEYREKSGGGYDFDYISPYQVLARSIAEATTTGKSLISVLSEGIEGKIASHRFDENDDLGTGLEGGLMGITSYSGQSLQGVVGTAVPVLMPENREKATSVMDALRTNLARGGSLSRILSEYTPKPGNITRLIKGAFDIVENIMTGEDGVNYVDRSSFQSLSLGKPSGLPKEYKHGQAGVGERREEAVPFEKGGSLVQAKAFEINWAQGSSGALEPVNFNTYVALQGRMPWQQQANDQLGMQAAPSKNVLAGITFVAGAMPFGSGASLVDTSMYSGIEGFGVRQYGHIGLSGVSGMDALRQLDLSAIKGFANRKVGAGKGSSTIGALKIGDKDYMNVEVGRSARDKFIHGASLSIAPYFRPGEEGGKFYSHKVEGAISTREMADEISRTYGIEVNTYGRETPEIIYDYLSDSGGSPKDIGFKAGWTPHIGGPMTFKMGDKSIRMHQMSSEIKSMPMAFGQSFMMQNPLMQSEMVERLPEFGRELSDWMLDRYQGGPTDIEEISGKYSELMQSKYGKEGRRNWVQFSEDLLNTFIGADDSEETLMRYGVAHVRTPQWLSGGAISESEMIERNRTGRIMLAKAMQEGGGSINVAGKQYTDTDSAYNAMIRFTPMDSPTGEKFYRQEFFTNEGFAMPLGTQVAPEMGGWGSLNYRQVSALTLNFPKTASLLGLTTMDSPTANADPAKRAWASVKMWEAYDKDAARFVAAQPDVKDATEITPEDASKLYAKIYAGGEDSLNILSDEERLSVIDQGLSDVLGDRYDPERMLYFSKSSAFLPGAETIRQIDKFDEVTGGSEAKISLSWAGAFDKLLMAQDNAGYATPSSAARSVGKFRSMMANTLSGRGVAKNVFGFDAPGMEFHRYSGMGSLNAGEVYIPGAELQRMLGGVEGADKMLEQLTGGYSPSEIFKGWTDDNTSTADMARRYLPGFAFRQPDMSRMFGMLPAKIITDQQLAARGISPDQIQSMRPFVGAGVSSLFSILGVGDEDRDPLQVFLSAKNGRTYDTDEMKAYYSAYEKANTALAGVGTGTLEALSGVFGDSTDKYHILADTISSFMETTSGKSRGALAKGTGGRHVKLDDVEGYFTALKMHASSKENMGSVYNWQRLMESSSAALGIFTDDAYAKNVFDPMQLMYQKAIDLSMADKTAILNTVGSVRIHRKNDEWVMGMSIKGMGPDSKDWITPIRETQRGDSRTAMRAVLAGIAGDENISNEALSYLFSPSQDDAATNLAALQEYDALRESDPDKWGNVTRSEVLTGDKPLPSGIKPNVSERSTYMNALWTMGVSRSLGYFGNEDGKYNEIIQNAADIKLPYHGKLTPILDIANSPEVFLNRMMYGYQTQYNTSHGAHELIASIGKFREIAGGPLTQEAIGKMPMGAQSYLSDIKVQLGEKTFNRLAQMEGSVDVSKMMMDQAQAVGKEIVSEWVGESLKSKPTLWASELATAITKKEGFNSMEKIVAQRIGLRDVNISKILQPGSQESMMSRMYPLPQELVKRGEAFETGWVSHVEGEGKGTKWANTGNKDSFHFDYEGAELSFKPDWLAWDPENRRLKIAEHKATKYDASYGGVQASINAIGFREIANRDDGLDYLVARFKDFGFTDDAEEMALAAMAGDMDTYYVGADEKSNFDTGHYVYRDPQQVDWQAQEKSKIRSGVRSIRKNLGNLDFIQKYATKVMERAENIGQDMSVFRSVLGLDIRNRPMPSQGDAKALEESLKTPIGEAVNELASMAQSGGNVSEEALVNMVAKIAEALPKQRAWYGGGGAKKDTQLAASEARGAVLAAAQMESDATFQGLPTKVTDALSPIVGNLATGRASTDLATAYGLDPEATRKAMQPYMADIQQYAKSYKDMRSKVRDVDELTSMGIDVEASNMKAGVDFLFDEEDLIGQIGREIYDINSLAGPLNIGGKRGPMTVGQLHKASLKTYAEANIVQHKAHTKYQNALMSRDRRAISEAALEMHQAGYASDLARADLDVYERMSAFEEEFGGTAPRNLDEVSAYLGTEGINTKQADGAIKIKEAIDKRQSLMTKATEFGISTMPDPGYGKELANTITLLERLEDRSGKLNKELGKLVQGTEEYSKVVQDNRVEKSMDAEIKHGRTLANILGEEFDLSKSPAEDVERARGLRQKATERIRQLQAQPAGTPEDKSEADALAAAIEKSNELETATNMSSATRKAASWGGVARRALGGFGLMYLGSITGMWLDSSSTGYEQYTQSRERIDASLGKYDWNMEPLVTSGERYDRALALQGGGFRKSLNTVGASIAEEAPGALGALDTAKAYGVGFAGLSWLASLGGPLAKLGPATPALSAALAVGSFGLSVFGAMQDDDSKSTYLASQYQKGNIDILSYGGKSHFATSPKSSIWNQLGAVFDKNLYAYSFELMAGEEGEQTTEEIMNLSDLSAIRSLGPKKRITDTLSQIGVSDGEAQQRYLKMYTSLVASQMPGVAEETIGDLVGLQEKFGFGLTDDQFKRAAWMMERGAPIVDVASRLAGSSGLKADEQYDLFGDIFKKLIGRDQVDFQKMISGEDRWRAMGPAAKLPAGMEIEEAAMLLGSENERAAGIRNAYQSFQDQKARYGYDTQDIFSINIPDNMTQDQYNDYLRGLDKNVFQLQTSGGGMFASAFSQYLPAAEAAQIGAQYGMDNQAKINAASGWAGLHRMYGGTLGGPAIATQSASLVNQYGAMTAGNVTSLTQQFLNAGIPADYMQSIGTVLGDALNQFTPGEQSVALRAISGDIGAGSWLSNNRPDVLSGLGMDPKAFGFLNQFGAPIYETSLKGLIDLNQGQYALGNKGAVKLTGSYQEMASQLLGTTDPERIAMWENGAIGAGIAYNNKMYDYQMAGIGLSYQSLELGWAHTQQMWGFEDKQRKMQHRSQLANFASAEQRIDMQTYYAERQEDLSWRRIELNEKYSNQGAAINRERMDVSQEYQLWNMQFNRQMDLRQRQWTTEDWGYQDDMRSMNAAWSMEDINEAIRYSHGRQRRQLVKQRDRMGISQDMEETRVETERERQQELWESEDERYEKQEEYTLKMMDLEREQFELGEEQRKEYMALDKEQWHLSREQRKAFTEFEKQELERSKKEYNEMFALQTKIIKAEREFQTAQVEIQRQQLGIQAAQAEATKKYQEDVQKITNLYSNIAGSYQAMAAYDPSSTIRLLGNLFAVMTNPNVSSAINNLIRLIDSAVKANNSGGGGGGGEGGSNMQPGQLGDHNGYWINGVFYPIPNT